VGVPDGHVYRALVDGRTFDVAIRDAQLIVNGEAKDYTFKVLPVQGATKMKNKLTAFLGEGGYLRAPSGDAVDDAALLIGVEAA
jgi:hypothetical protein